MENRSLLEPLMKRGSEFLGVGGGHFGLEFNGQAVDYRTTHRAIQRMHHLTIPTDSTRHAGKHHRIGIGFACGKRCAAAHGIVQGYRAV